MSHKGGSAFKPIARELIFDIDMDDYSSVLAQFASHPRFATAAKAPTSVRSAGSSWRTRRWFSRAFSPRNSASNTFCSSIPDVVESTSGSATAEPARWQTISVATSSTTWRSRLRRPFCGILSGGLLAHGMIRSVAAKKLRPFFVDCMIESEENGGQDVLRFDPSLVSSSKNQGYITDEMILEQSKNQRFGLLLQCVESKNRLEIHKILTKQSMLTPKEKWNRIERVLEKVKTAQTRWDIEQKTRTRTDHFSVYLSTNWSERLLVETPLVKEPFCGPSEIMQSVLSVRPRRRGAVRSVFGSLLGRALCERWCAWGEREWGYA